MATPDTNHATPTPDLVYAWIGPARNAVPARVEMARCPTCHLLVETAVADAHAAWHEAVAR